MGVPGRTKQAEIEWKVYASEVAPIIRDQPLERQIDFADKHAIRELVGHAPRLGKDIVYFRPIGRVKRHQAMVLRVARAEVRIGRIVAKLLILDQVPDDVDAEPIDPASKPETHHLIDGRPDGRVTPVEIRLSGEKGMIEILSASAIIFPRATAEYRQPIVGRSTVRGRTLPDVPVALATSSRRSALQEPRMPIGGVVGDQIENDLEALRMGRRDQRVEVVQTPEPRIDVGVVRDVVDEVCHGRREDWRQTNRIDSELEEIRQALREPAQVTDAVTIGVLKRARIDLIDDAGL